MLFAGLTACTDPELSDRERRIFASLQLDQLKDAQQPSNQYLNDQRARALGKQLFHDVRLSRTQTMSCASCHKPELFYTDGLPTPDDNGINQGSVTRNTPTLLGSAWNIWQYWDGRRDSLWSQALTPIEAPAEMASTRVATARLILQDDKYRNQYEALFGHIPLSLSELTIDASPMGDSTAKREWYEFSKPLQHKINTVFANTGKTIGAWQSTLRPPASRFDQFLEKLANNESTKDILSRKELAGARLFINDKKTQCLECHNGPLMTNGNFHNVASATFSGDNLDFGRTFGVQSALLDEFNCQGRYSDADKGECKHLQFLNRSNISHTQGAFKTPTLRNVANTAPYFHDGRFASLREVILHYNAPPPPIPNPQHDLRRFILNEKEIDNLVAFLQSLNSTEPNRSSQ